MTEKKSASLLTALIEVGRIHSAVAFRLTRTEGIKIAVVAQPGPDRFQTFQSKLALFLVVGALLIMGSDALHQAFSVLAQLNDDHLLRSMNYLPTIFWRTHGNLRLSHNFFFDEHVINWIIMCWLGPMRTTNECFREG